VFRLAPCLFSLPVRSIQVLWLAAGVGKTGPGSPGAVARTLHMTLPRERAAEALAISQLRAAGRHGCPSARSVATSGSVSGVAVSLPVAFLTTAAQAVGGRQTIGGRRPVVHAARRDRRTAGRRGGRGIALETAAIAPAAHGSMLWTFLLLALVLLAGLIALGRRRVTDWAGAGRRSGRGSGGLASRLLSGRSPEAERTPSSTGAWPELMKTFEAKPFEEIAVPPGGWAEPAVAPNQAGPSTGIDPPAGGWAPPPLTTNGNGHGGSNGAAAVAEITAPPAGWAPALLAPQALADEATPPGNSAPTSHPVGVQRRSARRSAAIRVAGGALAALLAARRSRRG
jgi:hypothetical protein